jgi:hypothetical protein
MSNICVTKPVQCPTFVSEHCPIALREFYSFKILFPFLFILHPTCHYSTWHFEWDLNVYINSRVNRYYYIQVWYEPFAEYSEAFFTVVHVVLDLVPDVPETVSAFIIKGWCDEHCVCLYLRVYTELGQTTCVYYMDTQHITSIPDLVDRFSFGNIGHKY